MTPEETKLYIEQHLNALGWSVHIGHTGYEKIFRFTEGNEDGARRLYHKLLALGGLQDTREINEDLLDMAMIDLAPAEVSVGRSAAESERRSEPVPDLASIEQLAAVLEAKMADNVVEEVRPAKERMRTRDKALPERPVPGARPPTALVADAAPDARARVLEALAEDFTVIEASDGEEAWELLLQRPDIELLVAGLALPTIDGYELIRRVRGTSRSHLAMLPIVVFGNDDAGAKLRALMAGANDFLANDAPLADFRARVMSRHRLGRSIERPNRTRVAPAPLGTRSARAESRPANTVAFTPRGRAAAAGAPAVETLSAEPRSFGRERTASANGGGARESVMRQVYRVSATTTITLSATALLAIAILTILYVGRNTNELRPTPAPTEAAAPSMPDERTPPPAPAAESNRSAAAEQLNEESSSDKSIEPAPAPKLAPSAPPVAPKEPERANAESGSSQRADSARTNSDSRLATSPPEDRPAIPESAPRPSTRETTGTTPASPNIAAAPRVPEASVPINPPSASPPNVDATARAAAPTPEPNTAESNDAVATRPGAAVVPPAQMAPAPTPPPAATRISRDELATFLRRFAAVYEAGDAEQFVGLFADNARTNDRIGRKGIRDDYETLFRSTDMRRMKLGQMSWEIDGNQAYGWGDFDVTVRRSTDRETYGYAGSMTFVVEKVDGRLRIVRLYHDQRRAGARG